MISRETSPTSRIASRRTKDISLQSADIQRAKGVDVADKGSIAVVVAGARRAVFSVDWVETLLVVAVEEAEATAESVDALARVVAHGAEFSWSWDADGLRLWVWEGEGCWEEGREGDGDCLDCVHCEGWSWS
jgi:hypothetical protein